MKFHLAWALKAGHASLPLLTRLANGELLRPCVERAANLRLEGDLDQPLYRERLK